MAPFIFNSSYCSFVDIFGILHALIYVFSCRGTVAVTFYLNLKVFERVYKNNQGCNLGRPIVGWSHVLLVSFISCSVIRKKLWHSPRNDN